MEAYEIFSDLERDPVNRCAHARSRTSTSLTRRRLGELHKMIELAPMLSGFVSWTAALADANGIDAANGVVVRLPSTSCR